MEKSKKTLSAEELFRRILELEKDQAHIQNEISKIMLSRNWPKRDGAVGVLSLFSEINRETDCQMMGGMKLTETEYFNIVQSMGQAIMIYDLKHRIVFWSRAAVSLFGYTAAEAYGKTLTQLLVEPTEPTEIADYLLERTVRGDDLSGEFPATTKEGEHIVILCTNTPFRDGNKRLIGGMCVTTDTRPFKIMINPQLLSVAAAATTTRSENSQQTSISSKISDLASKMKLKMKTTEEEYGDNDVSTSDYTYQSSKVTTTTTTTTTPPTGTYPFGVFTSRGTEERSTGKFSIGGSDDDKNLSSKAEAWMGKMRIVMPWKTNDENVMESVIAKYGGSGWYQMNIIQEHHHVTGNGSGSAGMNSTPIKGNAIIQDEIEIFWEDLITMKQIGQGSCGAVYHALWHGSEVAVKVFAFQEFADDMILSFKQEVSIMKRLHHPNILLFMGAVISPQHLCIVTEFLPRGSLFQILQRNSTRLDRRRRLSMAMDIARGMNYLHHCDPPIVHRDLKSSNLLVDKNWTVKVGDFGLSRMKDHTYLKTNSGKGTPQWMAPELLRNEKADEKSDVYSYGVVLWEIITEKIPWDDLDPMQVIAAVGFMNQRLEIPKHVDDPLWVSLIESCWCSEPQSRPTFQEILYKLKGLQKKFAAEHRR